MASTPNLLKASEITVKATLNDEIRRFKFNRTKGFNGLVEELKTFFGLNSTDFVVQYKDDEGDNITMGSDSELAEAVALSKNGILNLLLVSGGSSSGSLQSQKLSMEESFYHIETSQSFTNLVRSDAHSQSPVASASPAAAPASPASPASPPLPLPVVPNAYTQFVPTPYHKKPQQPQPIPQPHQQPYPYYPHYAHPFPQQPYMPPFTPPPILMTPSPSANFYTNVHQQRIKLQEWREEQENAVKQWKAHEKQVRKQEKQERKQAKATAKLQKPPPLIARFVKDVTIQDGMHFPPNTPFTKTWRLRNESSVAWPDGAVELVFDGKGSDQMNGPECVAVPGPVPVGAEVDITLKLTSPSRPGRYVGYWRLRTRDGERKFGQRLWVQIHVTSPEEEMKFNEDINRWRPALDVLQSMGFTNTKQNIKLLNKHQGNMQKTLKKLHKKVKKSGSSPTNSQVAHSTSSEQLLNSL